MTDVLDGAPSIIARPALDLVELGHEPLTAAGLTVNTLRNIAAGKAGGGEKIAYSVRNEAREAITEWGRFKLGLPQHVRRGVERIETTKRPIDSGEAVKLTEKAAHRLAIAEGLLLAFKSASRNDSALSRITESVSKLVGESSDSRAALESECAVDRFLVEALGYAKHPIKGEGGKFHGMHGVERAVKKRTLIPTEDDDEHPALKKDGEPEAADDKTPVVVEATTKPPPDTRRAAIGAAKGPSLGDRLAGAANDPRFDELHPRSQGGEFASKGGGGTAGGTAAKPATKSQIATAEQVGALLEALGFDPSNLAGFQKQVQLVPTGRLDPVTYELLREMAAKRAARPAHGQVVLSADQTSAESGGTHGPQTPRGRGKGGGPKQKQKVVEATVVAGVATPWGGANPSALTVAKAVELEVGGVRRPRRRDTFEPDVRVTDLLGLQKRLAEAIVERKAAQSFGDVAAFTRARAREQGLRDQVKEATMGDGKLREDTDSRTLPDLPNKKGKTNWVEKAGGLPSYIERIAKHLHSEKGMTVSRAIATAVNVVKKMCASGDLNFHGKQSVNAGSRAEACKAVAEWERKKGSAKVKEAEVLIQEAHDAGEVFYPSLPECFEIVAEMEVSELRGALSEAVLRRKLAASGRDSIAFEKARAHENACRNALREATAA